MILIRNFYWTFINSEIQRFKIISRTYKKNSMFEHQVVVRTCRSGVLTLAQISSQWLHVRLQLSTSFYGFINTIIMTLAGGRIGCCCWSRMPLLWGPSAVLLSEIHGVGNGFAIGWKLYRWPINVRWNCCWMGLFRVWICDLFFCLIIVMVHRVLWYFKEGNSLSIKHLVQFNFIWNIHVCMHSTADFCRL